jgi:isoquinoline 1-oxidoreductase beta subunit|nr:xanthine dehydrogenase family protein molybdopterin-binding subunit [Candidatus Krumholzibacteria bacterium]
MSPLVNLSRRDFLKAGAAFSGALILGFKLEEAQGAGPDSEAIFNPNAWLEISPDGPVIIHVPWTELGQGVLTAMSMILAEELEADWEKVEIRKAWNDPRFGRMGTGGSRSIRTSWDPVRQAGAAARVMLEQAAAARWGVSSREVVARQSYIHWRGTDLKLSFAELAKEAARLDVPRDVPLKTRAQRKLVGTSVQRIDAVDKATGRALFGCDHRFEGMVRAVVARCPVLGGKVASFDARQALKSPGVVGVHEISNGVAVLANTTWEAIKGREALSITWDEGDAADLDSAGISALLQSKEADEAAVMRRDGDFARELKAAPTSVQAVYELPYLSHSPMEPMNCTAWIEGDHCEVWGPIQSVSWAEGVAAEAAGVPSENVRIQPTYSGGGFGRRLMVDYVREVVEIAKASGSKVQLFWTREDNTRHGFYRPASRHAMKGTLDSKGRVTGWSHHLACPSISGQLSPDRFPDGRDEGAVDGAINLSYAIDHVDVLYSMTNTAVPTGWLRSVYNTQNAMANECFVDELAVAAGRDPVALRREMLPADSRLLTTLNRAAREWGWPGQPPAGRGWGVACHASFGSYVTNMAEVSVQSGRVRVHKVLCVVDCGPVVHPDGVRSQMEGGTAYALSGLLREEITVENGRVQQSNFDDYLPLRLDEMPEVEVIALDSELPIGGIGEPGYPAVGPAVLNAVYNLTGQRVRKLPLAGNFKG